MAQNSKFPTTSKALSRILNGETLEQPVVQVLAYKKVSLDASGQTKYRFILSDGDNSHQCCIMTGDDLIERIEKGEFERYTLIKLNVYNVNDVKGNKVIIITEPQVVSPGAVVADKIGNPQSLQNAGSKLTPTQLCNNGNGNGNGNSPVKSTPPVVAASPAGKRAHENSRSNGRNDFSSPPNKKLSMSAACPISALNSFQRNWTTKGRVTRKSDIRNWNNAKGTGKLFNFDLKDETGEIRATAFNAEVDKYYDKLQVGKVYIISKASVKAANQRYSNLKNEYEISLNTDSLVESGDEGDSSCPQVEHNFVPISQLNVVAPDTNVDVIGVITNTGKLDSITQKKTQKELQKREITIVDQSLGEIRYTLWGNTAANFAYEVGTVVIGQGARVSDYQGRALSGGTSIFDPNIPAAHQLKDWYESSKDSMQTIALTQSAGAAGSRDSQVKLLFQLVEEACRTEKTVYGTLKVNIARFTKLMDYNACANENCNKRLMDMHNDFWRCEKCNRDSKDYKTRIVLNGTIADASCFQYFSAFSDQALQILEKRTPEEVVAYKDNYENLTGPLAFRDHLVKIKIGIDSYQEEKRIRINIIEKHELDHNAYSRKLIAFIRGFTM